MHEDKSFLKTKNDGYNHHCQEDITIIHKATESLDTSIMSSLEEQFIGRVQQRLEATGQTANAASVRAGLNRTAVKSIIDGKSANPRLSSLVKLAPALECSVEWLATGLENSQPNVVADGLADKKLIYNIAYYMADRSDAVNADPTKFAEALIALYEHFEDQSQQGQLDSASVGNVIDFVAGQLGRNAG